MAIHLESCGSIAELRIEFHTYYQQQFASLRYRLIFLYAWLRDQGADVMCQSPVKYMNFDEDAKLSDNRNLPEGDVVLFGKCDMSIRFLPAYEYSNALYARMSGKKVIYDMTDQHFGKREHYHDARMAALADVITCPTEGLAMQLRDFRPAYARKIVVIPDANPCDFVDRTYGGGNRILWFGNKSTFMDSIRLFYGDARIGRDNPNIDLGEMPPPWRQYPIEIVCHGDYWQRTQGQNTGNITFTLWEAETEPEWMGRNDIAVMPFDFSEPNHWAKSPIRLMQAVSYGLYVAATPIGSYQPFKQWLGISGDIHADVAEAIKNPGKAAEGVYQAREYIQTYHSKKVIGKQWQQVLNSI